MTKQSASILKL